MLFDGYDDPPAPEPEPVLSAGQRVTLRQRADIARGVHPLTRLPLLQPEGHTCGDCRHRCQMWGGSRTYPKCDRVPHAASQQNDCRAWWPACTQWETK